MRFEAVAAQQEDDEDQAITVRTAKHSDHADQLYQVELTQLDKRIEEQKSINAQTRRNMRDLLSKLFRDVDEQGREICPLLNWIEAVRREKIICGVMQKAYLLSLPGRPRRLGPCTLHRELCRKHVKRRCWEEEWYRRWSRSIRLRRSNHLEFLRPVLC